MRKLILLLALGLAVLVGATFSLLNSVSVPVNLYLGQVELPLSILIFVSLLIGAILGAFACTGFILRHLNENRKLRKRIRLAEEELTQLRKIPIKDSY
ncbi:MAG: lipopolysaccharide assembly LapA domain-containing protein [Thioalkalivibrio sp.]